MIRELTRAEAKRLLRYNVASGVLRRRVQTSNARAGDVAGCVKNSHGYRTIRINGRRYMASRVIWRLMTGSWPPKGMQIDHIDGDKTNDAWSNLRLATPSQNNCNKGKRSDSTTGYKGVYFNCEKGGFLAQLRVGGKRDVLGPFDTAQEAARAYNRAVLKRHGRFAVLNRIKRRID